MASVFEDAAAAASAAVDSVYAKPWQYIPMAAADPNARSLPDPVRAPTDIVAFFFDPYARAFSGQARRQGVKAERPGHASSRPVLDLAVAQLPFEMRGGDRAMNYADRSMWKIAEVRPDGTGRAELDLNLLTAGST